ncbi:hypothetical protein NtB2_01657 [Lactococcus termiticola]|uniref:Uncharacterized protein n=1 Tax=Lactococcus termiticola TaxID=2169526 RepID=A0A2R5HL42_9LACT|nr:hypothetical protein NtB2_01657 [Lactococcus termiticola]
MDRCVPESRQNIVGPIVKSGARWSPDLPYFTMFFRLSSTPLMPNYLKNQVEI